MSGSTLSIPLANFVHPIVVATLSGPGGAHFRLFDSTVGHLLLETHLHDPSAGRLQEPESLGVSVAFATEETDQDIYVLTNGHILRRIDRHTGEVKWGWTAPDQT